MEEEMNKIKGCGKHPEAKQGCNRCNGLIGNFRGRAKKIEKLIGMSKAYGAGGNSAILAELAELEQQQNGSVL